MKTRYMLLKLYFRQSVKLADAAHVSTVFNYLPRKHLSSDFGHILFILLPIRLTSLHIKLAYIIIITLPAS